jgi:ferredoxin--NADP+ reductase
LLSQKSNFDRGRVADGEYMYRITEKKILNPTVVQLHIEAPLVANKARPGQFIILRVDEEGERIPLTVAGVNKQEGTVKIIYQIVGATTEKLSHKQAGDYLADFVGPLGEPTHLEGLRKVCIVGGGVGCAIALPIAEALHEMGAEVTGIIGFRNKDLLILEDEFKTCSKRLVVMTDDGSYGEKGNVTIPLKQMLEEGEPFDMIITIGPLVMMKYVVATAKPFGTPVTVSMNPIMIDGTGMCGGCRLTLNVDGKRVTKFACVDGPDFNGYEVDFDEAMARGRMYAGFERHAYEATCNLYKKEVR